MSPRQATKKTRLTPHAKVMLSFVSDRLKLSPRQVTKKKRRTP